MSERASIVLFRLDLRLTDQPALEAAIRRGGQVVPVFLWAPEEEGDWPPGAASRWWLHQSLQSLDASLRERGSRLLLRRGPSLEALRALVRETNAAAVFWNRLHEPALTARDARVEKALRADGLHVESFHSALLFEPSEIRNSSGKPFQVFTPFWRACLARGVNVAAASAPRPVALTGPKRWLKSLSLASLELEPKFDWAAGIRAAWKPGEQGAGDELTRFLKRAVEDYPEERDRPDHVGTSRLSPHLHFGEIRPSQVWMATRQEPYRRQLGWREFAHHLLHHFPHTPSEPLRSEFAKFPWARDARALRAWRRGRTGYPLVDAGMRELWTTGWMHNRVRMVVASFLAKDLLLPWLEGARWFWDTLVDADLANNTLGWQWVAGCGADAAPFFRIFDPVSQGEKFDPDGG